MDCSSTLKWFTHLRGKPYSRILYLKYDCQGNWTPANFIAESVDKIKEQVDGGRVVCALSGGVDSAVTDYPY